MQQRRKILASKRDQTYIDKFRVTMMRIANAIMNGDTTLTLPSAVASLIATHDGARVTSHKGSQQVRGGSATQAANGDRKSQVLPNSNGALQGGTCHSDRPSVPTGSCRNRSAMPSHHSRCNPYRSDHGPKLSGNDSRPTESSGQQSQQNNDRRRNNQSRHGGVNFDTMGQDSDISQCANIHTNSQNLLGCSAVSMRSASLARIPLGQDF